MPRLIYLKLEKIVVDKGIRKTFKEEAFAELVDSIVKHGILQPILVEPTKEKGKYRLLIGERRFRAAKKAGFKTIPAIVLEKPLKPDEALEVRLIENLHRENLDPLDEAETYAALREIGLTVSAIARRIGKSRPYVSQRMRLLKLHPAVRMSVRRRTIMPGHAEALLRLEPEQQLSLLKEVEEKNLSVKETRRRVRELLGKPLKWRLIPLRINLEIFEALQKIAPNGDVKKLIETAVRRILSERLEQRTLSPNYSK